MSEPIARDPVSRDRLLHRAAAPIARDSRIRCDEQEVVLFLGNDTLLGELSPGTHALASSPLASRIDPSVRCFFLSLRSHKVPVRFTRAFADPRASSSAMGQGAMGVVARVDFAGRLVVRVAEPRRFCDELMLGQSADGLDAMEGLLGYRAHALMTGPLDEAIQQVVQEHGSVVEAVDRADASALADEAVERVRRSYEGYGVEVLGLEDATLLLHESDRKRLAPRPTPAPRGSDGPPPAIIPQMLDVGTRVFVQWADGNAYPGVVRQFQRGQYEVQLDMGGRAAWVQPQFVRPA